MTIDNLPLSGVYLPLVTPFFEGEVDYDSIERLLARYRGSGIAGLVLLGTTGESPVLSSDESERIVDFVSTVLQGSLLLYLGVSGNDTRSVAATVKRGNRLAVDGYLITAPYYNRPTQSGLIAHFDAVVSETDRNVIVYNIPYRTGVNIHNDSLFELVDRNPQIVGVKDSSGDIKQTLELLRESRDRLSVLAGEDHLFFTSVALGGAGGILAAAHIEPEAFVRVFDELRKGDVHAALAQWDQLSPWIPLLFGEPNPAPLKVWLADQGYVRSPECRLPLSAVSQRLVEELRRRLPREVDSLAGEGSRS
ncbi:4-hydroxy-tetrahydrodipicolinate synthase [Streptomyces macrosporus]|uniref:4-hydroxy-tetrahydrodipicolinate synthase n=1 Tax=Streptomyces macrosporus TaxID=44032 RepID=A0ABN3JA67_9ACTN